MQEGYKRNRCHILNRTISSQNIALQQQELNQSDECTNFLSHKWDKVLDKISFKRSEIVAGLINLSKSGCLASIAQLWYPMGLAATCTIELGTDLEELWSAGYSWHEILPKTFVQSG